MSLADRHPSFIATVAIALCTVPEAFADSGSGDEGGLAAQPIPNVARASSLTNAQVAAFDRGLRGESLAGVAGILGTPDAVHRGIDNDVQWQYRFGRRSLVVSSRNGRVCGASQVIVNREEEERQTGVREDDFVGLVGP